MSKPLLVRRGQVLNGVVTEWDPLPAATSPATAVPAVPAAAPTTPVTPAVRATAERLGVDLSTLTGTGAGGRITRADVASAAGDRPLRPEDVSDEQLLAALNGADLEIRPAGEVATRDAGLAAYAAQLGLSEVDLRG